MSQGSLQVPTVGVVSGLTMAQDMNNALAALYTSNSGSSAPTNAAGGTPILGQMWLDTTSATKPILKQFDGTVWQILGTLDVTNGVWTPPIAGGVATTIASASTTDLGSVPEAYVTVSGTTTITSLGSSAKIGTIHIVTFSGILTLTYNASSLILPTAANITTAAGDVAAFVMTTAGNWKCLWYTLASGAPLSTTAVGAQQLVASSQGMNAPLNLRINATVGSNALTVAIKTAANADASSSSPVLFPFRDPTIANGDPIILSLQAALSFTVAAGNTLGTPSSSVAFRLWVIAYYNGGTLAVGLFNAVSAFSATGNTTLYPLNEGNVITTAASTNGGNNAGTHYANVSTITSSPFRVIGYLEWGSGLATAGTWASAPTLIKLFGPGDKLPGDIVQTVHATSNAIANTTSTTYATPATGAVTAVISPTSACNRIKVQLAGSLVAAGGGTQGVVLSRGQSGTQIGFPQISGLSGGVISNMATHLVGYDQPNLITASTYTFMIKTDTSTVGLPSSTASQATIVAEEIMS